MSTILLVSLSLVAVAVLLLGFRVFFTRDGKFPQTHVGGNKNLRDKGINCHTSQHYEAQRHRNLADRIKEIQ